LLFERRNSRATFALDDQKEGMRVRRKAQAGCSSLKPWHL
jgi:hypothetical protein